MKTRIQSLFIIIVLFFAVFLPANASPQSVSRSLIFDHASVDRFETIPVADIVVASSRRLMFRHASVGGNINEGLDALQSENKLYDRSKWEFQNRGNPGWQEKITDFATQVSSQKDTFDVFSMKLCFIDQDALWYVYRNKMVQLEAKNHGKQLIWTTMPLVRSADDRSRDRKYKVYNDQIRKYAKAHGKILLDIADIESDGLKNARGDEVIRDQYVSDESGHLNAEGSKRVAKALWVMMSALDDKVKSSK